MRTGKSFKLIVVFILTLALGGCTPKVQIISPADGASFDLGEEIIFSGEAMNVLGISLPEEQLVWTVDGEEIGTGTLIKQSDFSVGTHIVKLSATSKGDTGFDEVTINIGGTNSTATTTTNNSTSTTIVNNSSTTTTANNTSTTTTVNDSSTTTTANASCGDGTCNGIEDSSSCPQDCPATCTDKDLDGFYAQEGCGTAVDCNDNDASIYPGAFEKCDGKDNDCNQSTPDGSMETWYNTPCDGPDTDLCQEGSFVCSNGSQVCTDETGNNIEICDGQDNDCDGTIDEGCPSYGDFQRADLGSGSNLNGAIPFPADNAWNTDISSAPVDPNSSAIIQSIGLNTGLTPSFGASPTLGIPYVVVAGSQPMVPIQFVYVEESDPSPYPVPPNAPIEGNPANNTIPGDRHVLVIDRDANRLYELYNAYPQSNGSWQADSGAVFHLDSNNVRPGGQPGWASADAAGMPIFPGLVRYEESSNGVIRHALRFMVNLSRQAYVPPATRWASNNTNINLPPMGMRVRLKASYVIPNNFSPESKAILQALKTYGMFLADIGSNWYISGAPDSRWNDSVIFQELSSIKGSDFEVVLMEGLVTP